MKRILCYGDSNTWGYDPRSYLGERYPANVRWTGLLGDEYEVLEAGLNGREIPRRPGEMADAAALLRCSAPLDLLLVMLGTNDLLGAASARSAAERMRRFLEAVMPGLDGTGVLLIAPPPLESGEWVTGPELAEQSADFAVRCRRLASAMGIFFADAGKWGVETVFDGVHFSEEGHRAFAEGLRRTLTAIK